MKDYIFTCYRCKRQFESLRGRYWKSRWFCQGRCWLLLGLIYIV